MRVVTWDNATPRSKTMAVESASAGVQPTPAVIFNHANAWAYNRAVSSATFEAAAAAALVFSSPEPENNADALVTGFQLGRCYGALAALGSEGTGTSGAKMKNTVDPNLRGGESADMFEPSSRIAWCESDANPDRFC